MSEAKHTPGPWRIGAMESGRYAVDGENGQEVTGWIDSETDAHLIAAAPKLLAMLKKFIAVMDGCANWPDTSCTQVKLGDIANDARATIAKVEGDKQ